MLWNNSVVMMDLETRSLWSHILGRAMRGPLKGETLKIIPSLMTDWKTWRSAYPESTVVLLTRTTRQYDRSFYRDLSQFVIGIVKSDDAKAWPFDELAKKPIVNDSFAGQPLVIIFDKPSSTVFVLSRKVDGKELTFQSDGESLIDTQTGSAWNPITGYATGGSMKGKQLEPVAAVVSFRRAWMNFHPNTTVWNAP